MQYSTTKLRLVFHCFGYWSGPLRMKHKPKISRIDKSLRRWEGAGSAFRQCIILFPWKWGKIHTVPTSTFWKITGKRYIHRLLCLKTIFHWIYNHFNLKEPSHVYCIYLLAGRLQSLRNCWNVPWPICPQLDSLLPFYIQNLDARKSCSQLAGCKMLWESIHTISYTETLCFFTNKLIVPTTKKGHLRPDTGAAI